MSYQYRNSVKSAPESVTSSEQELRHLPRIPPKTSNLTATHTEQHIPIHSHSQHSYNVIVLPDTHGDVTSNELTARDGNRLEQLTRFCESYRDWQIRLLLIVIAKYIPIHISRLFDTVLLPYLYSLRHEALLDTQSVDRNATIARSLLLTPESGRNQLRELNIPRLTLPVNSSDFYADQVQTAKCAKRVKRPKTVTLVGEFRSELQCFRRWMGCNGCQPLLLIRFLSQLVKRSSPSQLQLFANCLQERLNERVDMVCLPDTVLTKVFSFLDPASLACASAVNKNWRELALDPTQWRHHVRVFGEKEGLSELDKAVEMGGEGTTDWRETYKDFYTIRRTMDEGFAQAMKDLCRKGKEKKGGKVVRPVPGHRIDMKHSISPYSALGMKLLSKASLRDLLRVVRDRHGHSKEGSIEPEDVQSLLKAVPPSEKERRAQELANRSRSREGDSQFITTSKEPLLPLIECGESVKTSLRSGSRSNTSPLPLVKSSSNQPQSPHKRVLHPSVYRDDVRWRVFDFIHTPSDACTVDPSTMDSRFYMCLSLAGCIPNTQSCNQGPKLPSPLFPLRSVRLFIEAPQQPLFTAACDSRRVLVSSADLRVRLFDSRSGREIGCLEEHKGGVNCIAVAQGIIVTGSWDCTVVVWDSVHFEVRHVIHAHSESVTQLAVDKRVVISCSKDGEVSVWRRGTWGLVASLMLHRKSVTGLALTNLCTYTASLDGVIGVWRNDSWQLVTVLKIGSPVTCMAVSRGLCVAGCENGYIRLWSLAAFREELSLLNASQELYNQVMASFLGHGEQSNVDSYKQLEVFVMVDCTKPSPIQSVVIINSFLFASNAAAVYQWSLATCSLARIMLAHAAPITCLTGDRHKLVSVGEDGRVVLWHTKPKPLAVSHQVEPLILFGNIKQIQLL